MIGPRFYGSRSENVERLRLASSSIFLSVPLSYRGADLIVDALEAERLPFEMSFVDDLVSAVLEVNGSQVKNVEELDRLLSGNLLWEK